MSNPSPHIVCFAPYTDWSIHSARQVTILHGLRQRGATVSYVTCDGVFSDCDLFQKATGAKQDRDAQSCLICQASVASRLAAWSMPYRWLGTWLTTQDRNTVGTWLAGLSASEYPNAHFESWQIGTWVQSSVRTHLRCNTMDMNDTQTVSTYGSYLYSGALAAIGLDRLFEEEKPDLQLLFNGRMAPTRIALELAQQKGIRTLVEERAAVTGRMILFEDVNCLDITHLDSLWETWKDVPLTSSEVDTLARVLEDRRSGGKGEVSVFSTGQQKQSEVSAKLGLSSDKPIWVLFTSSVDEIVDKTGLKSIFPTQQEWIEATLAYVKDHPDIQLVVRVHPNVGGSKALGENAEDIAYYKSLAASASQNVIIVQPDDEISSYTLAGMCDLALAWYSTIGIEAAAMGKRVVRGGGFLLEGRDFILAPDSANDYAALLDSMCDPAEEKDLLNITVGAWRFSYLWFLRRTRPFPLVKQPEWYIGEPAWTSLDGLKPGCDRDLDRICDIFLSNAPLFEPLDPSVKRDSEAERNAISRNIRTFLPGQAGQ